MSKQTFTTGQVLTAAQMTSLQQTAMGGGSTTAKTASYVLVAADAGTVVQMNAAGATTITVNTALFAAGDTVQIQNVGAGVCTVTAGTATVSTSATLALKQYDAGTLYFNTTSAALFFAVDAADSAGALVLIKAPTTFTTVTDTSTTFDGVFSSTYTNYIIYMENVNSSTSANLYFQWRVGATTQTGANYNYYNLLYDNAANLIGSPGGTSQTQSVLMALDSSATTSVGRCVMYTSSPGNSSERQNYNTLTNSQSYYGTTGGTYKAAIIPTGFILSGSTGTITGKVSVYGLAKS